MMQDSILKRALIPAWLFAAVALAAPVSGADWPETVQGVEARLAQMAADREATRNRIQAERERLTAELADLTADLETEEALLAERKAALDTLLAAETELRAAAEEEEADLQALEGTLRASAGDLDGILAESLAAPEHPDRRDRIAPLLDPDRMPGMADIETLVDVYFQEMASTGEIRQGDAPLIAADGTRTDGTVARAGGFTAFFRRDDRVGYLRRDPDLAHLSIIPGSPPWGVRRTINAYFDGEGRHLPLDISGGVIAASVNRESDWRAFLAAGGPLIWPILLIGLVALILCIERLVSLLRIPTQTDKLMDRLRDLVEDREWSQCRDLCRAKPHIPTCNVLDAGLEHRNAGGETLETVLEEAVLREMPRLERFLTTLGVLAAVAPLLGLLGTVTGMIHTFQGITVFGAGDPRMMSGGISEALITTQLGLAVAIPIMIAHHFYDRRVEKIVGDMEEKGTALVAVLMRLRSGKAAA